MPRKFIMPLPPKREWVRTKEAAKTLHFTAETLRNRIRDGTFKRGIHFRNVGKGMRPLWEFCLEEIEKLYE